MNIVKKIIIRRRKMKMFHLIGEAIGYLNKMSEPEYSECTAALKYTIPKLPYYEGVRVTPGTQRLADMMTDIAAAVKAEIRRRPWTK